MLSGPQRLHVDLVVRWDRCRVHQDLEVTLLQQFIDAGVPGRHMKFFCIVLCSLRDDIADCNQIRLRNLADPGKIRIVRDRSAAN